MADAVVRQGPGRGGPGVADAAVPALLLTGHVIAAVLGAVLGADRAGAWPSALGFLAVLVSAAALLRRAAAPLPVFCAVLTADATTRALLPEAALTPALPGAVWVALFSLSVRRPARVALSAAALATASTPLQGTGGDATGPLLDELLAGALLHLVIVLCGRLRAHREDRRARLVARLADMDGERRAAADAERERLARDLHDTAGHHLTAIAVQGATALRLADTRPELADEALAHGAAVGRDVLAALGELVTVVADEPGEGALHEVLPPLCAGLERLGVPVTLDVRGRPRALPPAVRVTAYRVVQESLTNAMRYAAGAPVVVHVRYGFGHVTVTATNGLAREPGAPGSGLGTGRGLANLTERAAAVGGRLTAGPGERGGWTVTATLPTRAPRTWWPRAADVALATACTALPLLAVVPPPKLGELCVLGALLATHAAPLLLRRRAPATALAAPLAVSLVWAVATVAGALPFAWLAALAFAWAVELAGLHAVGAYGPARDLARAGRGRRCRRRGTGARGGERPGRVGGPRHRGAARGPRSDGGAVAAARLGARPAHPRPQGRRRTLGATRARRDGRARRRRGDRRAPPRRHGPARHGRRTHRATRPPRRSGPRRAR
ncbi:sensor histidine kinase [Streptomyces sp. NRRL B-1347]|uniref:sensor histidine kinase n=1 Tax=Streptomyces sp. NRRL B-1347 TaxID=1476877 RepID=UPI000AB0E204|nr:histidine kinase [Streptomyces sp. NRRL B-1347]